MAHQKIAKLYAAVSVLMLLGALASTTNGQEQDCQNTPEGRVCRVKQEIRAGVQVSTAIQQQLGLVTVNGGCSGTLLNQYWVLTARHCVTNGGVSGALPSPNQVQITAAWTAQVARADRFHDFRINSVSGSARDRDIILVYLGNSNLGEVNSQRIYVTTVQGSGGSSRLSGLLKTTDTVTQYGRGFSTFATGVWGVPSATSSAGLGIYRSAQFTPSEINDTHYTLVMNGTGQVGHGGDSGGPSVVTLQGYGSGIAGVQSTCGATGYIPGTPKNMENWSWATGISACRYVSTAPFLDEIYYAIKETPAVVWEESVGGMLLAGKFRSRDEVNKMSSEDRRNTLITELANRTKDAVSYYQSLNDTNLAGAGALLVSLRESRSRTDQQIKTMSANDMRNTVIVEVNVRTNRSINDLQSLSNMNLAKLVGLKAAPTTSAPPVASVWAFQGGWQTVTNQNGHYTVILTITNLGQDPMLNETFVTGQFINTDGATQYNGILRGIIPRATRTLFYDYSQPGIKAGGKGQFTLSHDGNAITGNGTADGATFTWNGTRAK